MAEIDRAETARGGNKLAILKIGGEKDLEKEREKGHRESRIFNDEGSMFFFTVQLTLFIRI